MPLFMEIITETVFVYVLVQMAKPLKKGFLLVSHNNENSFINNKIILDIGRPMNW